MDEQQKTATGDSGSGGEEKIDETIDLLRRLHKIQFAFLLLFATQPCDPLHQSLLESVRQEGEEWYRQIQEKPQKRIGIRFLGDLSQLSQDPDSGEG
ncbi:MAG: hypothetical protein N2491_01840 [Negativicutes bacterium]|nr:hypothetical protein [Negativicutes bacterium]